MPRIILTLTLLILAATAIVAPVASASANHPRGAIKLPSTRVKRVGKVTCGKVGSHWLPGARLKHSYFLTDAQHSTNLARLAKRAAGRRKAQLRRQAAKLRRSARVHRAVCKRLEDSSPSHPPLPPAHTAVPLRFDVRGAVGLALRGRTLGAASRATSAGQIRVAAASAATSNLSVVTASGQTRDAVQSGNVAVSHFQIAPGNRIYVTFDTPVNLADTTQWTDNGCVLAEINTATGAPTCIDHTLMRITWSVWDSANPAIQFDAAGAIYYSGMTATGKTVLRRYRAGAVTDLVTDNVMLNDFLVRPDGSVFVTGTTNSTGASWVRRITADGVLHSVRPEYSNFLRAFPDGNVYMGLWNGSDFGVRRFLSSSGTVDPKYWLATSSYGDSYFDGSTVGAASRGFWDWNGTYIKSMFQTVDGKVFGVAGTGGTGSLIQYFPTVEAPTTEVLTVSAAEGVGTDVVLAGLNADGQNVMTLYDASTQTESELNSGANEIEVYHLHRMGNSNKVMFDGLRFADNKYVLGTVDVATHAVTVSTAGAARWSDLQTFG